MEVHTVRDVRYVHVLYDHPPVSLHLVQLKPLPQRPAPTAGLPGSVTRTPLGRHTRGDLAAFVPRDGLVSLGALSSGFTVTQRVTAFPSFSGCVASAVWKDVCVPTVHRRTLGSFLSLDCCEHGGARTQFLPSALVGVSPELGVPGPRALVLLSL